MYRNLPRQQFGNVQKALFPIYFKLQSAGALALLYLWTKGGVTAKNAGPKFNLWLLGTMVATGVINLVAVGPWTTSKLKRFSISISTYSSRHQYRIGLHHDGRADSIPRNHAEETPA